MYNYIQLYITQANISVFNLIADLTLSDSASSQFQGIWEYKMDL